MATPAKKKPAAKAAATKKTTTKAAPAAGKKANNSKTVLIVVGIVVLVLVIIPSIIFGIGAIFVGNKLADEVGVNGVNIDTAKEGVSIKDKNGNEFSAGGDQKLPDDLPKAVKIYPGTIVASGRTTIDGQTAWTVSISTNDDISKVSNSIKNTYSQDGWTTSMDSATNDGGYLVASNDTYRMNAFYGSKDGKTTVLYTVSSATE